MLDAEKKEWFCNKCHIGYFPNKGQKVKRANKFEALDQEPNVLVSIVGHDPQLRPRKSRFPRSFEGLKETGVSSTSFISAVDKEL